MTSRANPTPPDAGPDAGAPCASATQPCPTIVHARLSLLEVTFSGGNDVDNDTFGNFPTPHYLVGRAEDKSPAVQRPAQFPYSVARNSKLHAQAVFQVTQHPTGTESVTIDAETTIDSATLMFNGSVTVSPSDTTVTTAILDSNANVPNKVLKIDPLTIQWFQTPVDMSKNDVGSSTNPLYITLGNPAGSPSYWTPLDISCAGAAGTANEADFVQASFVLYRGTVGNGSGFRRKRDGAELTYYKTGAGTPSSGVFTCFDLLSRSDGTGRCGAWARFMVAMHQIHGVTSSAVFGIVPVNAPLLIVRNVAFTPTGSLPSPFTHIGNSECTKNDGVAGQGKKNPQFTFGDHALVQHATGIYDPSYGVGPKPDLKTWQDGAIGGIGNVPIINFSYGGDIHIMPKCCSIGFIIYTASAGDTLTSIAAKFGVASGTALLKHPYNAGFTATHPGPVVIKAGDQIFIPRSVAPNIAIVKII